MSTFPFINMEAQAADSPLTMFREYAYDFEHKTLLLKEGKAYLVQGNEALRIWIYFALSTPRYRHTAYDSAYGSEIEDQLMGKSMADEVTQLELERYITEALMSNPYIEELSEFNFEILRDRINVSFTCRTIYGSERMAYEVKGVV